MRGAHVAYRRMKPAEADKEAAEPTIKAAEDDLVKALRGYGELHNLPWPFQEHQAGFRKD